MEDIFGMQKAHGSLHQDEWFTLHPFIQWLSHKGCRFRDGRLRLISSLPGKVWSCISLSNGLNISQLNIMGWIISFPLETVPVHIEKISDWKSGWGKDKDITASELQSYRGNGKIFGFSKPYVYIHWNYTDTGTQVSPLPDGWHNHLCFCGFHRTKEVLKCWCCTMLDSGCKGQLPLRI